MKCPVCQKDGNWSEMELAVHVDNHFNQPVEENGSSTSGGAGGGSGGVFSGRGQSVGGSSSSSDSKNNNGYSRRIDPQPDQLTCMICGLDLEELHESARDTHVNSCLDQDDAQEEDHTSQAGPSTGFGTASYSGSGSGSSSTNRSKADKWWSPYTSEEIPNNYTPGLIPLLESVLLKTYRQGVSKEARLCSVTAIHIKGVWGYDLGWGCGYRNFLMGVSALISSNQSYRQAFNYNNPDQAPGVQNLQCWMEDGWAKGYDPDGREQMKNSVVGSKKWIGTGDLYPVFIAKGIPCKLFDFPKPPGGSLSSKPPTHKALVKFVVNYFNDDDNNNSNKNNKPGPSSSSQKSAFDHLMASGGDPSKTTIQVTSKMPLILQHNGHSRTIIGYEVNAQGNTNLLIFDPGKKIPADLRQSAIERYEEGGKPKLDNGIPSLGKRGHSGSSMSPEAKRHKPSELREDERMDSRGWVTKKVNSLQNNKRNGAKIASWEASPVNALNVFRVNLGALSRNTEYQILMFTSQPIFNQHERELRKVIASTPIFE